MLRTKNIILLSSVVALSCHAEGSANHSPESLAQFFDQLEGNWRCEGGTSRGKETAANISFSPSYDAKVYEYRQTATKGHESKIGSMWAYDQANQTLVVSRHYINGQNVNFDLFAGETWENNKLVLHAKPLWGKLWAENRFTYEFKNSNYFELTWEVNRGEWKMGDYLHCNRVD